MKISVFGLGYVGAVSLACLARDGHHIVGVDIDTTKLDLLRRGQTPIIETGMKELVQYLLINTSRDPFPTGLLTPTGGVTPSYAALKAANG